MKEERVYEGEVFRGLTLSGETVRDTAFLECEFVDCTFSGVEVRACTLRSCRFVRCRIDLPRGREMRVQELTFEGCFLSGVHWYEFETGNRYASLFASVTDSTLRYNTFSALMLNGVDLSGLRILDCTFGECELVESSFRETDLTGTEFFRCNLAKADFRDAVGYRIDLMTSKVSRASFSLPDVLGLLSGLDIKIE